MVTRSRPSRICMHSCFNMQRAHEAYLTRRDHIADLVQLHIVIVSWKQELPRPTTAAPAGEQLRLPLVYQLSFAVSESHMFVFHPSSLWRLSQWASTIQWGSVAHCADASCLELLLDCGVVYRVRMTIQKFEAQGRWATKKAAIS